MRCQLSRFHVTLTEDTYQAGRMDREYFEKSVREFSQETFPFGPEATDAILHEYTNWTHYWDETEIRRQYIDVSCGAEKSPR